ncbi:MAG: energy transducer TonB [Bacteroidales bacterium]|jgi:protein TonB|nr:energy transducer TonB [Bacteroidales bacterium]MCI2122432.1 energy transducer TonB [Bacteroidales bacterium]MCI2144999.1 energy transducer TonB [Bacteroidales bacterium]
MEAKKTPKADLKNKQFLFGEIGMIIALGVIFCAFQIRSKDKIDTKALTGTQAVAEEEIIPITNETPPPPTAAPQVPVMSDQIDIVDDNIKVNTDIINLEDNKDLGVQVMDYVAESGGPKDEDVEEEAIPFALVEEKPTFMGGDANTFSKWVATNLQYPETAKENGVQGRVTLQFTVNTDGSVSNVTVLRGVDSSLDAEAVRVVSSSPKWKPGRQRDRAVKVSYTFPVIFQLR